MRYLPIGVNLPKDYYTNKKMINDLRLSYNKIEAYPNDEILVAFFMSQIKP